MMDDDGHQGSEFSHTILFFQLKISKRKVERQQQQAVALFAGERSESVCLSLKRGKSYGVLLHGHSCGSTSSLVYIVPCVCVFSVSLPRREGAYTHLLMSSPIGWYLSTRVSLFVFVVMKLQK